jgi:hypothetical protein
MLIKVYFYYISEQEKLLMTYEPLEISHSFERVVPQDKLCHIPYIAGMASSLYMKQ